MGEQNRMTPEGLHAKFFEDENGGVIITNSDNLSTGLRQFGEGLKQLQSMASATFLRAADDAAAAHTALHSSSTLAKGRAAASLRHLPPPLQTRLEGVVCAAEIYRALLYEREAVRVGGGGSENYSRIGDVLTFMSAQPEVMACIDAHRTIEEAYALATAPVPCLHFKHRTTKARRCYFTTRMFT